MVTIGYRENLGYFSVPSILSGRTAFSVGPYKFSSNREKFTRNFIIQDIHSVSCDSEESSITNIVTLHSLIGINMRVYLILFSNKYV